MEGDEILVVGCQRGHLLASKRRSVSSAVDVLWTVSVMDVREVVREVDKQRNEWWFEL